ncbi:MAG: hypothetical protein IPK82_03890 [Polyangiaceae bacterium]|nr:hypothetical protein [Polyangiaceae bacterium]
MRNFIKTSLALFIGLGTVALSTNALAFERQWHLGAGASYSPYINPAGVTLHGFGGGVQLVYGISDTINALAMADLSVHPATTHKGKPVDGILLAGGSLGLSYVFDILQWVPWVGATAGAYYALDPVSPGGRLALGIPFGLDYQVSRSFAVGAAGEYKLFFLDPLGAGQRFSVTLRAEYIWGY